MPLVFNIGNLSYNGVDFDVYEKSMVTGQAMEDAANRTIKYMKYTIEVDAIVTIPAGQFTLDQTMEELRAKLTKQGGPLEYTAKGFGLFAINTRGAGSKNDVAWGPMPELLAFRSLGGAGAAAVTWRVTTCILDCKPASQGGEINPLLAFTYTATKSFGEDGFSTVSWAGELEIAMTRTPASSRTMPTSVEFYRSLTTPDMPLGFRPTRRDFNYDNTRRTLTFSYSYEEMPEMGQPINCTVARGSYSFGCQNLAMAKWENRLSATFIIQRGAPRREAWMRFYGMMFTRMHAGSVYGAAPALPPSDSVGGAIGKAAIGAVKGFGATVIAPVPLKIPTFFVAAVSGFLNIANVARAIIPSSASPLPSVIFTGFNATEGIYLDSKTTTFEVRWRVFSTFSRIFAASGIWQPSADCGYALWKTSMQNISGSQSWYPLVMNVGSDRIIDGCTNLSPPPMAVRVGGNVNSPQVSPQLQPPRPPNFQQITASVRAFFGGGG